MLEQSLALIGKEANELLASQINKYMLQIFDILGLKELDIKSVQGIDIALDDDRTVLDLLGGLGVLGLGHNHPRTIATKLLCHVLKIIDCIKIAPHKLPGALACNISRFFPPKLAAFFLAVSGAEANEAAMKLAERVQTPKGKTKILCMRLKRMMAAAAESGSLFHLWWHQHNFGTRTEANLEILDRLLCLYHALRNCFGMRSRTIIEAAA